MNNLRENTGVILWILVFSFGVIWVLQDSNVFDTMNQPTGNVAVVNGAPISYERYQNVLEQQRRRFRQQVSGDLSPRMEEMMREQAYNQLVNAELIEQEMQRLGITVTEAEVEEMVYGENPHPIIRQQFADSTGQIDRQLLRNVAQNPEARQSLIQLEQILREQRRQEKMSSLVQATVHVSEEDVQDYYMRQNAQAAVRYVALRYASVSNDSISVTDADLRDYYDAHREDFKREKTYTIEYITQSKTATAEDTAAVVEDLRQLRDEFEAAENDSLFLAENASDRQYSGEYVTPDEMEAPIADAVYQNLEPGRVVGPVFANEAAHLIKIKDTRPAEGTFVHARHILLRTQEDDMKLLGRARALKDSIQAGADFAAVAREFSDDPGSASQGGDLGWFGRGRMAEPFEEAAFDAPVGEIVGPVKTRFGYHLIEVTARADRAVQFADMALSLRPSLATLTQYENKLEDVAYFAEESKEFRQEAERQDLTVQEVEVEAEQENIPGIGQSRALATFLEGAEEGAISSVIELNDKFVVAHVQSIQPEGYRPFEQVKAEIRPRVELEKKRAIQTGRMRLALREQGFDGLADALGTRVRTKDDVTYQTNTAPGIGSDPAFAGTTFGLEEGETSGVVEGENAAFVVHVTSRTDPEPLTPEKRQEIRAQLLRQQQQQVASQWIAALRDRAQIDDTRSVFQQ